MDDVGRFQRSSPAVGDDPPPRDAKLWHPQFARKREQAQTLSRLPQNWDGQVRESVDLRERVGNTTILHWREGFGGHWRLRGGALTLPMLWQKFGSLFTAQELMYYYQNCPKMVKPRPHPVGSAGVRASAWARKLTYGHWGHRDGQ